MKLATLDDGSRDGRLVLVTADLSRCMLATDIAHTLQEALDTWDRKEPRLRQAWAALEADSDLGEPYDQARALSPLPRAYQWADGSAYLYHVELVRKARGAEMPESFLTDPLMYQGGSDAFLAPHGPIALADEAWGIDFEGEVAVITDDVPMGVSPEAALGHIKLVMLVNDVSLRNLIPGELGKGFGFFQAKPSSAFSPVAVTPDRLGGAWQDGKLSLPIRVTYNGEWFGHPNAGTDMNFSFGQLIAHAARTRPLGAGCIVGSGTVSNRDPQSGSCCLAEKRMIEIIEDGTAKTPFMKFGDRIQIEMIDNNEISIFGSIDQEVVRYHG